MSSSFSGLFSVSRLSFFSILLLATSLFFGFDILTCSVLNTTQVAGAQYGVVGPALTQSEASDLLSYVTDVAVSVGSLLRACSDISDDHAPGQEELAALALRLQGKDGDVSPEGFAASLALTFEASLPALEALLLTGKVRFMERVVFLKRLYCVPHV